MHPWFSLGDSPPSDPHQGGHHTSMPPWSRSRPRRSAAGYEGQIVVGAFRPNGNERTREDGSPKRKRRKRKERPPTDEGGQRQKHCPLAAAAAYLGNVKRRRIQREMECGEQGAA